MSGCVDNWQGGKTLAECNLHMLNTEDFCDVTLRCGSQGHVSKAHRYVLISRSCVFHTMFTGPLAEKSDIIIPEIDHRFFKQFILYIYTDTTTVEPDNATALLCAVRKYAVTGLENKCFEFLDRNLTVDNACVILEEAHRYDQKQLMEKALTLVEGEGERSLQSLGFLALSQELVDQIVESDNLVADEHVIFTAVNNWSEAECGRQGREVTPESKRSILGDVLMKVRFPLMKQVFLVNEVTLSGLLTDPERLKILKYGTSPDADVKPFNTRKRHQISYTVFTSLSKSRFLKKRDTWDYTFERAGAISFKVNRNLMLCGYQLFSSESRPEATYCITTYWEDYIYTPSVIQPRTSDTDTDYVFDVMLTNPITVTADTWYTLCVVIEGPNSLAGKDGITQVLCDDGVEFNFRNSDQDRNGTSVRTGQIPTLFYRLL